MIKLSILVFILSIQTLYLLGMWLIPHFAVWHTTGISSIWVSHIYIHVSSRPKKKNIYFPSSASYRKKNIRLTLDLSMLTLRSWKQSFCRAELPHRANVKLKKMSQKDQVSLRALAHRFLKNWYIRSILNVKKIKAQYAFPPVCKVTGLWLFVAQRYTNHCEAI